MNFPIYFFINGDLAWHNIICIHYIIGLNKYASKLNDAKFILFFVYLMWDFALSDEWCNYSEGSNLALLQRRHLI